MLPIILLIIASAFGQDQPQPGPQASLGKVQLVLGEERDPDGSFGGLSGLAIDNPSAAKLQENPKAAAVFWAVSDDSRVGADVSANPRYFDGSVIFQQGSDGQFVMDAELDMVFPLPRQNDEERLFPEGFHFCGEFLYVGNGASDVRRFRPTRDTAASIDAMYPIPAGYYANAAIEGVTVEKSDRAQPYVYSVTGGAPARYADLDGNPVSVLEWDANAPGAAPRREFLIPQAPEERTMDFVWESGRRFFYLVSVGAVGASAEAVGQAARPRLMRLYACQLPAIGDDAKNVMNMDAAAIQAAGNMMVQRKLMAEFSMEAAEGAERLVLSQDSAAVEPKIDFDTVIPGGPVLPLFDGIAFGPAPAAVGSPRPLYLISDNAFDAAVPTRYISMMYTPPPNAQSGWY